MRAARISGTLIASWLAAYYGEKYVKGSPDAILILVTVITVFAGFLVAIIAVLGDPALIPPGSWRVAENRRDTIESDLIRHTWLFVFYLVSIGVLFIGAVAKSVTGMPDIAKIWITRGYLFFGLSSFLFTFGLAGSLLGYQMARYDAEIKRRRKEANIPDDVTKS